MELDFDTESKDLAYLNYEKTRLCKEVENNTLNILYIVEQIHLLAAYPVDKEISQKHWLPLKKMYYQLENGKQLLPLCCLLAIINEYLDYLEILELDDHVNFFDEDLGEEYTVRMDGTR